MKATETAAQALVYPFRPGGLRPLAVLAALVLVLPLSFPLVLGYGVEALRSSRAQPESPPPPFRAGPRMAGLGLKAGLGLAALSAPFAAGTWLVAQALAVSDAGSAVYLQILDEARALLEAGALVALPWGAAMLLILLPNLAPFASRGRLRDLVNPAAAGRTVRRQFAVWNVAGVATVTAWALAVASTLACGVGGLFGIAYAILVTAHAAASIPTESQAG